jgi:glycosyltransferase involved in cell wall biosynthesis
MSSRVALIMPMLNEAADLPETLASIATQTFDKKRLRFIAIDGDSTDGSREIVTAWLSETGIDGEVIVNPRKRIPISLNAGAQQAGYDALIIRLDAHTTYGATYVEDVVRAFDSGTTDVGNVGCAQIPAPTSDFEHAVVGELLTHPLGLARTGVRDLAAPVLVETVYLGSWRPGLLFDLGGFDERWIANEDSELEARLRAAGWKLLLIPSQNLYKVNRGVRATIRQWGGYGFWRAQTSRRFPHELRARHFIPAALLVVGAALLFTPWRWLDAVAYTLYGCAVVALRDKHRPLSVALGCCVAFPCFQIAWTIGFLRGIFVRPPAFEPVLRREPVRA